jgi:hypothetical protein
MFSFSPLLLMLIVLAEVLVGPSSPCSSDSSSSTIPARKVPGRVATITNNITRFDCSGGPLNAHQGSMIRGAGNFSARYYLYGDWFRGCQPLGRGCRCVGDKPGMKVDGVGIFSTADFTHWRHEDVAGGGHLQLFQGSNQPRVAFFPSTGLYHMYLQFPLRLATSISPTGPWQLHRGQIELATNRSGDMNVFVDADGVPYLIYTAGLHAGGDGRIRVQRLSLDGRRAISNATSLPFPPSPCEAPLMFRRKRQYYALFGHNCGCCRQGSEVFVFTASHPLGPWKGGRDINTVDSADGHQRRVVNGQSAFVLEIVPSAGGSSTFLWAADEWGTGVTRAANHQYWGSLAFYANGSVRPLGYYQHAWQLSYQSTAGGSTSRQIEYRKVQNGGKFSVS